MSRIETFQPSSILLAREKADRHPRRNADHARHHRHRRRELLAIPPTISKQEVLQRLIATAGQRLGAVGELAARADKPGLRPPLRQECRPWL